MPNHEQNIVFASQTLLNINAPSPDFNWRVIRRNGAITEFEADKITKAVIKAFLAVEGANAPLSARIQNKAEKITQRVCQALTRLCRDDLIHIEDIQDQVELALMRSNEYEVGRAYMLYREQRRKERERKQSLERRIAGIRIQQANGELVPLKKIQLKALIDEACQGLSGVSADRLLQETYRNLFDGMQQQDLSEIILMNARTLIEKEPNYSLVAARLLLDVLRKESLRFLQLPEVHSQAQMGQVYADYFKAYVQKAIELQLLDPRLADYDLDRIAQALQPELDLNLNYLGLQILYDRYLIHDEQGERFELPQAFFMRVAMGLALNESEREAKAIEFYRLLSSFDFMSSTPTLFNSGTLRPQLSSCYLTTVPDDLEGIYDAIKDNALLSKFAGGLGNDWTPVRGMGAHIKGTNGKSQGVVPFLKVVNDTAVAVNQGGKRRGAVCAYLESWHIDIEEFLELRKNTGDERRRTHDMNTANWIPDLFMKRVLHDQEWTLFSPDETPDLHELTGQAFEQAYLAYEQKAERGEIKLFKRVNAVALWRKMINMLYETGHPWITFKDPCNIRYTNQHIGVVHSSNLCTEITLHTNRDEIAVCNLGSINLAQHILPNGDLDAEKLQKTIKTAIRMLDNVIEYNYYAVPQAQHSNLKHRPIGLGIMGFQDALHQLNISYASPEAVEFADRSMEMISYYAIQASCELAQERGPYSTFQGSLWSQGILPIDSIELLAQQRGSEFFELDRGQRLDWDHLREQVKQYGMRNSNVMAIAPTATISNICGVSQSIEPVFQNLFVKSNLSGEFTVVNPYLVQDLKKLGLWDEVMVNDLKHEDGSIQNIQRIPAAIKRKYLTAYEIDQTWLVEAAARRQKWVDQAQSLNLYIAQPLGKKLDQLYKLAWKRGLKTTYYLRSTSATRVEKTVIRPTTVKAACSINDSECEACQ